MAEVTITISQAGATLVTIQPIQLFVGGDGGSVPRFARTEYAISGTGPYTLPQTPALGLLLVLADGVVLGASDYTVTGTQLSLSAGAAAAYTGLIVIQSY